MLNDWSIFLLSAVTISLTGVMGPGPITAATLAAGARHRHAGLTLAVGHAIVEFPLLVLIVAGLGRFFQIEGVKIAIGLVGGGFLIVLGGCGVALLFFAAKFLLDASAKLIARL